MGRILEPCEKIAVLASGCTVLVYGVYMNLPALEAIQLQTLTVLREVLNGATKVAFVDFPNHENSGDSLIYLGELAYLKQLGVEVTYVTDYGRYDKKTLQTLAPEGPILLHGGGNFGDRWLHLQKSREEVIGDFPERHIIQLPQTIDFTNGPDLSRAQAVMSTHPNLTILIRDHAGVERTRELFPTAETLFCPDMAFGYGRVYPRRPAKVDVLVLKRQDVESVQGGISISDLGWTHETDDWGLSGRRKLAFVLLHVPGAFAKRIPFLRRRFSPLLRACYLQMAKLNVVNAIDILARGRVIVTDRLHATVLAALMGKNVIALDNANGKISAITQDYLGTMPTVRYSASPEQLPQLISDALSPEG